MKESEGKEMTAIYWRIVKRVNSLARLMLRLLIDSIWLDEIAKWALGRRAMKHVSVNNAAGTQQNMASDSLGFVVFCYKFDFFIFKENWQWCARRRSRRQQFRWKWLNIEISEVFNDQQTETLPLSDNMVQFLRIWFCNQESLSEGTKSWSLSWLIDRRRLSEVDTW